MKLPKTHPYRRHAANARAVLRGLTQAERSHKEAIRSGSKVAIDFAARVHHMMVGLLAEALLRKIAADPAGFNDRERVLLAQERGQLDRWKRAVELAVRRHYAIPIHLDIDHCSTEATVAEQFSTLVALLDEDLAEIIEDRNNIAHGQWAWRLNSKETTFVGPAPVPLNYRAIEVRSKIVRELEEVINDLVDSEATFVRDFQRHYSTIQALKARLDGSDYDALVRQLKARRAKPTV